MRALIQRVKSANVQVNGERIGAIDEGLLILICAMSADTKDDTDRLANKISKLRIFRDEAGRMNKSLLDVGGEALVVSQFTLAADTSRGNRPGFSSAAPPDEGRKLYEDFAEALLSLGIAVATGEFGADMDVTLTNDGPVTIWIDTET